MYRATKKAAPHVSGSSVWIFLRVTLLVKVKFTLEQAIKAQRGSRGIVLLFL